MKLGDKIIALRKARGMSQEQMAQALDVSRQAVSKWELNEAIPDVNRVVAMSDLFGVTTDYLLKTEDITCNDGSKSVSDEKTTTSSDRKWLGMTLVIVCSLCVFGMWAITYMSGVNYSVHNVHGIVFSGTGLMAYLFYGSARPVPLLVFCGLIVGLIGGIRILMGKQFWFKWHWRWLDDVLSGNLDDLLSEETKRFLQDEDDPKAD